LPITEVGPFHDTAAQAVVLAHHSAQRSSELEQSNPGPLALRSWHGGAPFSAGFQWVPTSELFRNVQFRPPPPPAVVIAALSRVSVSTSACRSWGAAAAVVVPMVARLAARRE
jgi:hypothetical protein